MPTRQEVLHHLGATIAKHRQKRGITLEKLAYEMGMAKGNLSDIERGKRDPRYTTLRAIATGLKMTLAQLLEDRK
jgi:transcriptional regulator with XRE-family HTH domain